MNEEKLVLVKSKRILAKYKVSDIRNGLWVVYWNDGGSSLASIGRNERGEVWITPTNWISGIPCYDCWGSVFMLELVEGG